MRKHSFGMALLCALIFALPGFVSQALAQNVRWDLGAPGSAGAVTIQAGGTLFALGGVQLNWCNYPANAVPCTNFANTYPSSSSATPCPTNQQIVLQGSTTCVSTGDSFGNLGVWTNSPNIYAYTLTVNGVSYGPYAVTLLGPSSAGVVVTFSTGSWPAWLTPSVANPTTAPQLSVAASQQGNGNKVQLSTGNTIPNDCGSYDSGGNITDNGAPCGVMSATTTLHLYDEFCGYGKFGGTSQAPIGELGWYANGNAGGTGGVQLYSNSLAVNQSQHPCIIYINENSSTNWEWLVLFNINTASGFLGVGSSSWTMTASVSNGIDTGASRFDNTQTFGWVQNTGQAAPAEGIYLQCQSPASPTNSDWLAVSQDGGGTASTDTGIACNTNFNFNDLRITSNGSGTITFYINGSQVATQTTHIPTVALNPAFGVANANSSTNNHQLGIDFFELTMTISR